MSRDEAAKLFVRMLVSSAYDGAQRAMLSLLEDGPPGRGPCAADVALHAWFQTLDESTQHYVRAVVREAVYVAVFGAFVLLDGATGGYPVQGEPSDFGLYLQIYESDSARRQDAAPSMAVRLNPHTGNFEDLHDLFLELLDERQSSD